MPVDLKVTGANQLRDLGRDLKAAGSPASGLRRELLAAMRLAGKPLAAAVQESARQHLPRAGGLNEWVAGSSIKTRNRLTGGARVGMRIVATKGNHDLEQLDSGKVRHPVFGNRRRWVSQPVYAGWFEKPLNERAPEVQASLLFAVNIIGRRLEKGVL